MAKTTGYRMSIRFDSGVKSYLRQVRAYYAKLGISMSLNDVVCALVRRGRREDLEELNLPDELDKASGE